MIQLFLPGFQIVYILNTSFPLKHIKNNLNSVFNLYHLVPWKEILNAAWITYKSVFFTAAMVTKLKMQNPPFILPPTQITAVELSLSLSLWFWHFYPFTIHQSHPFTLFSRTLQFFHSYNVFFLNYIYLLIQFYPSGYTHTIQFLGILNYFLTQNE